MNQWVSSEDTAEMLIYVPWCLGLPLGSQTAGSYTQQLRDHQASVLVHTAPPLGPLESPPSTVTPRWSDLYRCLRAQRESVPRNRKRKLPNPHGLGLTGISSAIFYKSEQTQSSQGLREGDSYQQKSGKEVFFVLPECPWTNSVVSLHFHFLSC